MHIENVAAKATRVLGMLYRVLRGADAKTRKMAYFTLVRSILEYGCAAWDLYEILKHSSKYKLGHFDLYLDYRVGLASRICVKKQT